MGYELWNHGKFLTHKVRNFTRRGWLLKTYNSGKLLTGRVKTGEKIENDDIDILHPVGMVAHVKPDDKCEIFTMDVGGDTSRRVISHVIGDREEHPQPDEGEVFNYAPGDKKIFTRYKKKKQGGAGGGGGGGSRSTIDFMVDAAMPLSDADRDVLRYGQLPNSRMPNARAAGGGGGGGSQKKQTKDSGREPGMHSDADDKKVSSTTQNTNRLNADGGIGNKTKENLTMDVGKNTQFEAQKHVRIGAQHHDTQGKNMFVKGNVFAHDHVLGSTNVSKGGSSRAAPPIGMPDMDDGSNEWSAEGVGYSTSLLSTAVQLDQFEYEQEQQNNAVNQILSRMRLEGGTLVIDGPVRINGNLTVTGTLTHG